MDALPLIFANLALALTLFAGLWGLAQITRDPSFVDAFWAFGITLMAVSSFWLANGWEPRQQLITALVAVWGLRLGLHLFLRWRHEGADRRYEKLLADVREKRGWSFGRTTAFFVFLPQAALLWVASLPAQLGQVSAEPGFGLITWIGVGLAIFGIAFETLADWQLSRFKADPDNAGKVMDQGLWAWSRHPNYFAEAVTWWGIWLIAAQTWVGALAIAGPLFLTFTLTRWSGAPMLERGLARTRPGYADYVARVSPFIPWPPKRAEKT
jgi:steroid 5-alpha reductase family enzyme